MAFKDSSKQWFETGDFPTQEQFAQVFEWLRWKDEKISIDDIPGLDDFFGTLIQRLTRGVDWNGIYNLPQGYLLQKIIIVPSAPAYCYAEKVGGTPGDIIPEDLVNGQVTLKGGVWQVDVFDATAVVNIEIKSLPVGSVVYFFRLKVQ